MATCPTSGIFQKSIFFVIFQHISSRFYATYLRGFEGGRYQIETFVRGGPPAPTEQYPKLDTPGSCKPAPLKERVKFAALDKASHDRWMQSFRHDPVILAPFWAIPVLRFATFQGLESTTILYGTWISRIRYFTARPGQQNHFACYSDFTRTSRHLRKAGNRK